MISAFLVSLLAASVSAHGVIIKVQGTKGSPDGIGFQVDESIARNCTTISPCQLDTTIIRDAEINANIVNQCGRTELAGNIDVGENTENQLAAGTVTQVTAGSTVAVTIHQVNADGAGPYVCDLDVTSNSGIISQNLTVTNNVPGANGLSQAKTEDFVINVAMPDDLACTGGSTGNICTVRCRNNAVAGPFGGCFPVQQTDVTPTENSANQIQTLQSLDVVNKQIEQNIKDLPVAVEANQNAGADSAVQNKAAVDALLGLTITSSASPVQTPEAALGGSNNNNTTTTIITVAMWVLPRRELPDLLQPRRQHPSPLKRQLQRLPQLLATTITKTTTQIEMAAMDETGTITTGDHCEEPKIPAC
ncbi:hypothetical protein B0O99DRAFT_321164 [Bisporella sp. PMI_857]|nr:hypothetical protein B0O99DRAFT_371838 [Bisporella sp. PMI_857]KAH8600286.1 hypothetical protein B0O99DRAFT_321164 [Bisporella sp. PMI_857]